MTMRGMKEKKRKGKEEGREISLEMTNIER